MYRCTCSVHVVYTWCSSTGVYVEYMLCTCSAHVVYMLCTCGVHLLQVYQWSEIDHKIASATTMLEVKEFREIRHASLARVPGMDSESGAGAHARLVEDESGSDVIGLKSLRAPLPMQASITTSDAAGSGRLRLEESTRVTFCVPDSEPFSTRSARSDTTILSDVSLTSVFNRTSVLNRSAAAFSVDEQSSNHVLGYGSNWGRAAAAAHLLASERHSCGSRSSPDSRDRAQIEPRSDRAEADGEDKGEPPVILHKRSSSHTERESRCVTSPTHPIRQDLMYFIAGACVLIAEIACGRFYSLTKIDQLIALHEAKFPDKVPQDSKSNASPKLVEASKPQASTGDGGGRGQEERMRVSAELIQRELAPANPNHTDADATCSRPGMLQADARATMLRITLPPAPVNTWDL